MRQAAVRSRKVPQMASEGAAEIPARTLRETPVARAFPLDLRPLILPYRVHRCLTLRIEELPQRARLSAGQNNGDCSWSVTLDELEGLSYCPPQGFDGQHDLKLRIISKDETGASTVALLDFHVICDDEHANAATAQSSGKIAPSPQDGALREEIASLRAACAAQDAELSAMRTSSEQVHAQWEKNLAKSLTEAEAAWKSAEALRLDAAMADLQTRFDRDLADMNRSAQAKADASGKRDAAMLRRLNQELSDTKDALAGKDTELAELRDRLERLRHDADTEIAAAKEAAALEAAEQLKAAETQWQEQAASSMAEVTARCRAAEEALASARAADTGKTDADAELAELHDRLERLRHDADTEIAAAKEAAALEAAEQLKAAETQWQEQAASSMAEVTARCRAAEEALASARAADTGKTDADAELAELHDRLERLRHDADTEIAAAKEAAALEAAEQLKAAETQWQEQAASSMAEVTARCRAAEEALASARAADTGKTDADAELAELRARLERLRHDADTEIAAAKEAAALEAAEQLKAAETQWQEQAARSVAEITARCRAAEEALASASAADTGKTDADAELAELRARLERLRHDADTEIAAAKEAAALEAAEQLKAAETQWQEQAARSVAEVTARCRAAEEALASASAADTGKANADDAYIRRLNCEIKSLQNSLVEREADLAHAQTQLREMRPRSATPGPVGNWQPLSSIPADAENEGAKNSGHLWRDTVMVFVVVVGTAICWPWIEHALTTAGVVELLTRRHAVVEATPKSTPGPEHPTAIVARGVNLRAGPRTSAAVLATLTSGMRVTILGHSGNWDKVENSGADGKTRQGWVYNSYLDASRAENPKK